MLDRHCTLCPTAWDTSVLGFGPCPKCGADAVGGECSSVDESVNPGSPFDGIDFSYEVEPGRLARWLAATAGPSLNGAQICAMLEASMTAALLDSMPRMVPFSEDGIGALTAAIAKVVDEVAELTGLPRELLVYGELPPSEADLRQCEGLVDFGAPDHRAPNPPACRCMQSVPRDTELEVREIPGETFTVTESVPLDGVYSFTQGPGIHVTAASVFDEGRDSGKSDEARRKSRDERRRADEARPIRSDLREALAKQAATPKPAKPAR